MLDLNYALPIAALTHKETETLLPCSDSLWWHSIYGANPYKKLYQSQAWLILLG